MSAMVMIVDAAEFCTPGTTVSPTRTGRSVTTPSSGASASYFRKHVFAARESRIDLSDAPLTRN